MTVSLIVHFQQRKYHHYNHPHHCHHNPHHHHHQDRRFLHQKENDSLLTTWTDCCREGARSTKFAWQGKTRTPLIVPRISHFSQTKADSCLGFGKLFSVLQFPIGQMASRPMRNIETFPSKQMYLYLSLVERKVVEFYHNIDGRCYLVWLK